ncbi:hypothetical protein C8J57DRAFT_1715740 [Mycena rebaudengoi]|nr:hypothetical protein C8J57DRAFT_1715740 [Mycena rebaudengoi]
MEDHDTPRPTLNEDVILLITESIECADVLNLSLTSVEMRNLLLRRLYRSLHLGSGAACSSALPMLARRPDICAIIRELVVYPSGTWLVNDRTIDEASIADNIQMIAPNLRLHSFEWRGVHMAKDDMWMALKESCPELKCIRCIIGSPLNPGSPLLQFDNLTAFSLTVEAEPNLPQQDSKVSALLLEMLLSRCPQLEILELRLTGAGLIPLHDLSRGRWRYLRSLSLGSISRAELDAHVTSLRTFLLAHPKLQHIGIVQHEATSHAVPPLTLFSPAAPTYSHVVLRLCFENIAHSISSLPQCIALKWLKVDFEYSPNSGISRSELRQFLKMCPALTALHLNLGFSVRTTVNALRVLPHLHTFSLTGVYTFNASTRRTARLLFGQVPTLRFIRLQWTYRTWERGRRRIKEDATYKLMAGLVEVRERGLQLVGGAFSTRQLYKIGNFASRLREDVDSGSSDEEEPGAVSDPNDLAFLCIQYRRF